MMNMVCTGVDNWVHSKFSEENLGDVYAMAAMQCLAVDARMSILFYIKVDSHVTSHAHLHASHLLHSLSTFPQLVHPHLDAPFAVCQKTLY